MTIQTIAALRAKFETGDEPNAQDFIDLIDSFLHAQLGNFPDPLPPVSAAELLDVGSALPDPLPARDGSQLTNINPQEYNDPAGMPVPSYATPTTFVLNDNWTVSAASEANRVFLIGRRFRLTIGGAYFYSHVQNAVFAAGITTVTSSGTLPGSTIQAAAIGVIRPLANGGAVGASMIGAADIALPNTFAQLQTLNGGLAASGGTFSGLITANGGQIKFPSTQNPAADANTLDDYEEGSFTPSLYFNGLNVGIQYATRFGFYVKIGKIVIARVNLGILNKGSSTGNASFDLPIQPWNGISAASFSNMSGFTYTGQMHATTFGGVYCLFTQTTEAGVKSQLTEANFTNSSNFSAIHIYESEN